MTGVLIIREKRGRFEMWRDRRKGFVKVEAGINVMQLQAKKCWQQPEARREEWNGFLWLGINLSNTLISNF